MASIQDQMPNIAVSRGFGVIVVFFLGIVCFELLTGESLGVRELRAANPRKYWYILGAQACGAVLLVALLYFGTYRR